MVAVDRLSYTFNAGRVVGDQAATLHCRAIYPDGVRTATTPITIKESVPEPIVQLTAPRTWNGRDIIQVIPTITNQNQLNAAGVPVEKVHWNTTDMAVIKEAHPKGLSLIRALNSGTLEVALTVNNGGTPQTVRTSIQVNEPSSDPRVVRQPTANEMPADNQLYPRGTDNTGTLHCTGTLESKADTVFIKLYADGKLRDTVTAKPQPDGTYAVSVKLQAGLVKYRVEFGSRTGDRETVLHTADNIVCGDAYVIDGQSNAVATDFGKETPAFTSEWIRSFGHMHGAPPFARSTQWGRATHRARAGELTIGYWGMEMARRLVETHQVPIAIINGAVGGTRIDQHQRNAEYPEDVLTIYGRLLWRVRRAGLTHGIRAIFWHQGENDQGAAGPTGGYGWQSYRRYFLDMVADWKRDYPNVSHYYVFQIWPKSCAMGINGSDNTLREVQRNLSSTCSNLSVMSTLGVKPPGTCHYPAAGYADIARLITRLVDRDLYGQSFPEPIDAPNLRQAYFADASHRKVVLEFDQPMTWDDALLRDFYIDGAVNQVQSARVSDNTITLQLADDVTATRITYLDSRSWSPDRLLLGKNGIAALTFHEVPIANGPRD